MSKEGGIRFSSLSLGFIFIPCNEGFIDIDLVANGLSLEVSFSLISGFKPWRDDFAVIGCLRG